jgi:hypothetical protein
MSCHDVDCQVDNAVSYTAVLVHVLVLGTLWKDAWLFVKKGISVQTNLKANPNEFCIT